MKNKNEQATPVLFRGKSNNIVSKLMRLKWDLGVKKVKPLTTRKGTE